MQHHVAPSDCSYSISKTASETQLKSEIRLLPLSADIQSAVLDSENSENVKARVGAEEVIQIGVYSTDFKNFEIPENRLLDQSVTTRCLAHCRRGGEGDWADGGKWGGECVSCGNSPSNMGESCYGCMRSRRNWCRWQDWSDWKEYTTVPTGVEYFLNLSAVAETGQPLNYFYVKFLNQMVPGRQKQILTETITIRR